MAAIIEPRRHHASPQRPALRLVTTDGGRTIEAPLDLGIGTAHVAAAVVALVLALMLALAIGNGALAGLAPGPSAPATASAPAAGATSSVVVQPGDTLWAIARRIQPTGDVRPLVDQLIELNGSASLQAGSEVLVPR